MPPLSPKIPIFVLNKSPKIKLPMSALKDKFLQFKLFEAAEIAQFSPQERAAYEDSLKYYQDLNNVVNTSKMEGIKEGILEVAKEMKVLKRL